MKSKKDISDLIRDNQHKLDERPNPRAWKKLEERLDQHEGKSKGNGRIILFRRLAMAAAVVAMVAVISIINIPSSSSDMKAEANISPQDQFAQGLEPVYSEDNKNLRQVIEFQRNLKDRYANPIQEGMQTKKLKASNKMITNRTKHSQSSSHGSEGIVYNSKPEKPSGNQNTVLESSDEVASNITMTSEETDFESAEVIEETTVDMDDRMVVTSPAPVATAPPPPAMADMAIPEPEMTQEKKSKKKAQPDLSNAKANNVSGIQNLSWMAGNWVTTNKPLSILFLNNSDLVSTAFSIKEIGKELFFIDADNSTYELINKTESTYVFEQKNKDQIVLEKLDENSFSKTLIQFNSGTKLVEIFKKK